MAEPQRKLTQTSLWKTIEELHKKKCDKLNHVPAHTGEQTQECEGNRMADKLSVTRRDFPRQARVVTGNMLLMHPKEWSKTGKIIIPGGWGF